MKRLLGSASLLTLATGTALVGLTLILAGIQTAELGLLALSRD